MTSKRDETEVNKIKRKFFEINKINKPLDTPMRKKKDDKIIKNETCDILTDSTVIERTVKEYYE